MAFPPTSPLSWPRQYSRFRAAASLSSASRTEVVTRLLWPAQGAHLSGSARRTPSPQCQRLSRGPPFLFSESGSGSPPPAFPPSPRQHLLPALPEQSGLALPVCGSESHDGSCQPWACKWCPLAASGPSTAYGGVITSTKPFPLAPPAPPTPARLSWEKLVPSWPQSGLPSVVCGNSTWRMCLWPPLEENGCWSAWRGRLGRGAASQPVNKRASATGARQVLPEYWALAAQPGSCPSAGWGRGPAHLRAVSFGAEINPEATPLPLAPTPQVEEGQFWDET